MTERTTPTRFFFVIGSPRSGTTLLQSMLMQSPGVTIPPETKFVGITHGRRHVYGPIETDAGWQGALAAIDRCMRHAEFPVNIDQLRERLGTRGERSYARLFHAWLELCGEQAGATIVGEKSPAHTAAIELIAGWFPQAPFVHIVRDPRDVALSHAEVWGRPAIQAALRWRQDQKIIRRAHERLPGRVLTVRYEDLVTDPAPTVERLAEFLGIEYIPDMADPSKRKEKGFAAYETHKQQTLERVSTGRINRYRGKLPDRSIRIVQALCAQGMHQHGYELEPRNAALGWIEAAGQVPTMLRNHLQRIVTTRRENRRRIADP